MLRHPDEGLGQVGPLRGDLRPQHHRGAEARREDDRDLVSRVFARVEGALRQPRRRARRGVRVRGQALLRAHRSGARRRPARAQEPDRGRRSPSTTRATAAARRASTSRRATCSRRFPVSTTSRWSTTAKRGCAAARCSRSSARSRWPRFSAGTASRRRSTPAPRPSWRCARAARCSCATATSRTSSGCKIDDLARVVAEAAGYDIPETTEYSMYMWGFFDKFIILMSRRTWRSS